MVHVVFRHGARTPVYTNQEALGGAEWSLCSTKQRDERTIDVDAASSAVRIGDRAVAPCAVRLHHLLDASRPAPAPPPEIAGQFKNVLHGGCRSGQLTDLGCEQAYTLGTRLRKRYAGRLPGLADTWDERTMRARSTCVPRCVLSAQFLLAGLLPAQRAPVPLGVLDFGHEDLFPNSKGSDELRAILHAGREAWVAEPTDPDARVCGALLSEHIPASARRALDVDAHNFVRVRDVLVALAAHGMELPYGLGRVDDLLDRIERLATAQIVHMMHGGNAGGPEALAARASEVHRHSLGQFLSGVLAEFDARARGEATPALRLCAAHDTTVLPLLLLLGVYGDGPAEWPPFCASLAFELHALGGGSGGGTPGAAARGGEAYGVRVVYNDEDITARVPGCAAAAGAPGAPCPLGAFRQAVAHGLPRRDEEEGHTGPEHKGPALIAGGMSQF